MKFVPTFITALLGIFLIVPEVDARGGRGGGGGGGSRGGGGGGGGVSRGGGGGGGGARHHAAPQRSSGGSSSSRRSPMTGSQVSRPQSRPAPKQVSKPASKPQTRPSTKPSKPTVKKPSTGPATLPGRSPDGSLGNRPGPGGDNARPGTRPDTRPGTDRPGANKPSTLPGMVTYPSTPDRGKPGQGLGIAGGPGGPGGVGGPGGAGRPGGPGGVGGPGGAGRPGGPGGIGGPGGPGDAGRPGGPGGIGGPGGPGGPGGIGGPGGPGGPGRPGGPGGIGAGIAGGIGGIAGAGGIGGIGGIGDRPHLDNPNRDRRNQGLNRPSNLPANKRNWDNNRWGGNNGIWGNKVNIGNDVNLNIDNSFLNNNNFAFDPGHWGDHPWWGAGHDHDWHHGHWDCGWNGGYYHDHWWCDDDDFGEGFMWGMAAWGLGSMVYNMGYYSYSNPYPAPPIENTYITYEQPMSVATAANPPGDEATVAKAEEKSQDALSRSLAAFKAGDYMTASRAIDEALVATPSDVTLHEFRALVFFALGKYGEASGILNPVLASGPGWGWDTMIGFYDASSTYEAQLRKLEAYVTSSPNKAEGHFLLGYHYMVCGYVEKAYAQFEETVKLQPADGTAKQLRDLTKNSIPDSGGQTEKPRPPAPPPIPSEKLVGVWVSDRGKDGKITFTMKENGEYTWNYSGTGTPAELKGTYGLNDKGLLVLSAEDSQMVSEVKLDGDKKMHFSIIGAPDGDPGLSFTKG